jgi:hypothetical protein
MHANSWNISNIYIFPISEKDRKINMRDQLNYLQWIDLQYLISVRL